MNLNCFERQVGDSKLVVLSTKFWTVVTVFVWFCLVPNVWCRSLEPSSSDDGNWNRGETVVQESGQILGSCWQRIGDHNYCTGFFKKNVTKEECCSYFANTRVHIGWTPYSIDSDLDYFKYVIIGEKAAGCQACKTSCEGVSCGPNRVCRLIRSRPQCICDPDCSGINDLHPGPVCGFDGKNYRSQCSLIRNNCRQQLYVLLDYVGTCQYSCDNVRCSDGNTCLLDQYGIPHCVPCMVDCPDETEPEERVCGADGVTYPSMCHIERQTCIKGRSIRVAYRRPCQAGLTCAEACGDGRCLMDQRTSSPVCVSCDRPCYGRGRRLPLCGTDNTTYSNYCEMVRTSCSRGVYIETLHYGSCSSKPRAVVPSIEPYPSERDDGSFD